MAPSRQHYNKHNLTSYAIFSSFAKKYIPCYVYAIRMRTRPKQKPTDKVDGHVERLRSARADHHLRGTRSVVQGLANAVAFATFDLSNEEQR